jgi:hypothetical protein
MSKRTSAVVAVFGFLAVFGAVGGIEQAPDSDLLRLLGIAGAGLFLMWAGIRGIKQG